MTTNKGVLYARVSSDRQEKEGFSIPAQIKLIKEYAKKNNIQIVEEFVEAETAKKAGRTQFNNMLKFLRKNKSVNSIICEKTDRLYRNLKDYILIDEFDGLEIHLIKDAMILSDKSRSQDKFMHGIRVLMAKNYIDNLSEEIKKGLKEKAEQGYCPTKAPIGYKNKILKNGKRIIVINEEEAPFIKKAFELYASGRYTYASTARKLTADGFRPCGHNCTEKHIERILNNPFYIGRFNYRGKLYLNGQHEALISEDEYFIVQKLLHLKSPTKPRKHNFAYNGLIRCSKCGCMLTGEIQKGKYIYYHCTNAKKLDNSKPSIKQEKIEELFSEFLKGIEFTSDEIIRLKELIKDVVNKGNEYVENITDELQKRIKLLNKRLNKLYEDRSDGIIEDEFYYKKRDEWQNELDENLIKFNKCASSNRTLIEDAEIIIELCKNAYSSYLSQTSEQKAELMKLLTIELLFDGEKLIITPHSAFENLLKYKNSQNLETVGVEPTSKMTSIWHLHV